MQKDILKFIESQGSVFEAAKFFGGMTKLLSLVKGNPELYNKILDDCLGKLSFYSDSGREHEFKIIVTNFDVETFEEGYSHIFHISFDLEIKNEEFEEKIAEWVQSYVDDLRVTYKFSNPFFRKFKYIQGGITSVNGKKYTEPKPGIIIPDDEVEPLLSENVMNYIKKLQNLFD